MLGDIAWVRFGANPAVRSAAAARCQMKRRLPLSLHLLKRHALGCRRIDEVRRHPATKLWSQGVCVKDTLTFGSGLGRGVHICDVCVGVCNRILEATPETFSGWDAMTNEQLLDALSPAVATVEATRGILQTQVDTLRNRGVSWAAIGTALGISRQAAWERFS
jgi:hypothetical protein